MIELLHGDCRTLLDSLADESAQQIVTSPPYWQLRKYTDDPREIGRERTPAAYIAALADVFSRCYRVLRRDGTLWIVIGDTYANDSKWGGRTGGKHAAGLHGATNGMRERRTSGLPDGDLIGIPWRLAFALQDTGWVLRNEIIWHKPNAMPEGNAAANRCGRDHETVFMFAKQTACYFNAKAINTPAAQSSKGRAHLGKRPISARQQAMQDQGMHGKSDTLRVYDRETRHPRTVWSIATTGIADEHYAPMPEALAERCILAGSRAGDTVLDPFVGSGTTARVCERLQRSCIGIDLAYQELQAKRTDKVQVEMFV